MRQACSNFKQDLSGQSGDSAAEPTNNDGLDMTDVSDNAAARPRQYLLMVTLTGAGTTVISLRGKGQSDVWGVAGDNGGKVNGGNALTAPGTYYFVINDLGVFKRVKTFASGSAGGPPTISTFLAPIFESGD